MNVAKALYEQFLSLPFARDGFCTDRKALDAFRVKCARLSEKSVVCSPRSFDSPIAYQFIDSSVLKLSNPRQESAGAYVSTSSEWALLFDSSLAE